MRYLLIALLSSCTCFNPVDERPDAGNGGGAGGGGTGGAAGGSAGGAGGGAARNDGGCDAVRDCSGTRDNVRFCGPAGGAGWSCIGHECLWECNGARVCDVDQKPDGGCLSCGAQGPSCRGRFCSNNVRTARVEDATCTLWPGTTQFFLNANVTVSGGAGCRYDAYQAAGVQQLGQFEELSGNGEFLADFPTFGGTCTGIIMATGLERWLFNCPDCQFVLTF